MIIGIDASRANAREKTGTEWYSWHVIRELMPYLADHDVRLYAREALEPGLRNLGPRVSERILRWPPGILWSHLCLSWELWRHRPDVLFVPADTVPLHHPLKTITTIHDVAFERWPELYRGRSVQRKLGWLRPLIHLAVRIFTLGRYSASERDYHRWSARHALRSSPLVLTVSEFSKQEILQTLGGRSDQIMVTPLGVRQVESLGELTTEAINRELVKHQLRKPYILFIGRLEEKKNIRLLIDSYLRYRAMTADPVDLVLLGAPGYGWEAAARRIPPDAQTAVHQLGWVSESARWRLHAGARGLVFLSAYEGFGLPPLESLVLRVPVLASPLASLPEVLGDSALYAEDMSADAIAKQMSQLVTDEHLRALLVARGSEWVKRFTWPATAAATWQAFCRLEPRLAKKA